MGAFTLVELLVVLVIIAIFAGIVIGGLNWSRQRSDSVVCMSNMRGIHAALGAYINDYRQWPQEPKDLLPQGPTLAQWEDWWLAALQPYGIAEAHWHCPTLQRMLALESDQSSDKPQKLHYWPAKFDAKEFTPYKWAKQPWLVETSNNHGNGALILFPDGSIQTMNDVRPPSIR